MTISMPDDRSRAALLAALEAAGLRVRGERGELGVFVVAGELGLRELLDPSEETMLRRDITATIRAAHGAGTWICAPGLAAAAVLRVLEAEVVAGAAAVREQEGEIVVFPGLRLVTTDRPLLGRNAEEAGNMFAQIASVLSARAALPVKSGAEAH